MSANFSKVTNMDSKLKTDIETIAKHYGPNVQMIKFAEEAAEFSAATLKNIVYSQLAVEHEEAKGHFDHKWDIASKDSIKEMADVFVLVKQFEYYASVTPDFKEMLEENMKVKVERQLKRIEEEKKFIEGE